MDKPRTATRKRFRQKLDQIKNVLAAYLESDTGLDEYEQGYARIRHAIIMTAVDDLHWGNQEEQMDAIEYLQSDVYKQHADESFVPKAVLDKIIYEPEAYGNYISYPIINEYDDTAWMDAL